MVSFIRRLRHLGLFPTQSRTFTILTAVFIFLFFWLALFNIYDIPSLSHSFSSLSSTLPTAAQTSSLVSPKYTFQRASTLNESTHHYLAFMKSQGSFTPSLSSDFRETRFWRQYLKPLLVPRLPGTPEHQRVRLFLIQTLKDLGFEVELDSFHQNTVVGPREFHNIIATRFPTATKRMIWAAHYDSKDLGPKHPFLGATDSAAPCALLLELATRMKPVWDQWNTSAYAIQLVFFDGEEAFVAWSEADSIYGATHLAKRWEEKKQIEQIQVMILLDLLGAKPLTLRPFLHTTWKDPHFQPDYLFSRLVSLEGELRTSRLIHVQKVASVFNDDAKHPGGIADDHLPFQARGVPILHLIPVPFPHVWHQPDDNEDALDPETLENLANILTGLAYTQSIYA